MIIYKQEVLFKNCWFVITVVVPSCYKFTKYIDSSSLTKFVVCQKNHTVCIKAQLRQLQRFSFGNPTNSERD